jgi:hypothetical protein
MTADLFPSGDGLPQPAALLLVEPRSISLAQHMDEVECICDTIESLGDGDLQDEARDELSRRLLDAIAGTKRKVDNCSAALAMYEHAAEAAAKEEKRLRDRREFLDKQKSRLEDYVMATLTASGLKKIEGSTSTLAIRSNPPRVVVDVPASELPFEFVRVAEIPADEADKKRIAEALKRDPASVPGCRLVPSQRLIRS